MLWIRIRVWSDPKLLAGSGSGKNHSESEMNLKLNNYRYEKLIIFDISRQKCSIKKYFPKKLISRHNLKPNTQDGNTKVKFTLRILEKIHVGSGTGSGSWSETTWKVGSGSEKNHSGSTTPHYEVTDWKDYRFCLYSCLSHTFMVQVRNKCQKIYWYATVYAW